MYIEALKNRDFKEEFTYLKPKMIKPNNNNNDNQNANLYKDKEIADNCNKVNCQKNRTRKFIFIILMWSIFVFFSFEKKIICSVYFIYIEFFTRNI